MWMKCYDGETTAGAMLSLQKQQISVCFDTAILIIPLAKKASSMQLSTGITDLYLFCIYIINMKLKEPGDSNLNTKTWIEMN